MSPPATPAGRTPVLHGSRASRSAPDYRHQHRAGASVHDCTAAAGPGGGRSSCLSREKVSLQQLNRRLASYLQQVKHLEAANQRLEHQIQEELDRKCPQELRQLDGHLKTTSLLQDQISECLLAQAQLKLQVLEAELTVFDLSERCKKECEGRARLEVELSDLRLLREVLKAHNLPELQNLLNEQMQEMADLQIQHQQDMQVLLAEVTGGVAVEMHTAESSDLIQQVEHLRQTSAALLDKNQRESWCKTQVTFDPSAGPEADRAKLEALRREVDHLTAELTQLQAVVLVLEASGEEQTESLVQQLVVLQRTADGLCRDLDSVLQVATQQAADHQSLLDINSRLEAKIQNFKTLLDGLDRDGVSHVHFNAKPDARSVCLAASPPTFRSNIMVAAPLSKTLTAARSVFVHNKHPTMANPLVESFQKPENQRTGVFSEKMSKSIISTETVSRQSSPVEDEVHAKDHDVQSSLFARAQISQEIPNKRAFVKASKTEIITTLVPNSTDTIQTKQETLISKQAGSQSTGRGTNFRVETDKPILCAEADINQQPRFVTHETTFDLCKPTTSQVEMRETLIFTQVDPPEGSFNAKKKNPTQIKNGEDETSPETVKDVDETANTIHGPSGSSGVYGSTTVQGEVCSEGVLMEDTDEGIDGKSGKEIAEAEGVLSLDQSLGLSKNKPNKLTEDENTRCDNENASSGIPEKNNKLYSKTVSTENFKEEMDKVEEVHDHKEVKMNPVHSDNELLSTTSSETCTSLTDSGVSLSSSSSEEHQGSHQPETYLTPNDPDTCLIPAEVKTEVNNVDVDRKEEAEDTLLVLSLDKSLAHLSNTKLMKDAESRSSMAVSSPENKENLKRKTQTTEVLKTKVDEMEIVNNANKVKVDPAKSNKETVDLAGEEASKMCTSLTDSGVGWSCSSYEEFLSPKEVRLSAGEINPPPCLISEKCLSLVETEEMLCLTDHVFYPVEVEDHITSPDLLLSPNNLENNLSPDDSDSCLSPNSEEKDKATSLSLPEVNAHVRPVEKYILSTKEAGQSVSFSGERTLPEDRNMKVTVSEGDGDVCFRPFEGYEGRRVDLTGTKLSSRPTSAGLAFGDGQSIIADREEQVGFGGLYRKRDARRSRGKCASGTPDEDKIESVTMDSDMRGHRNSDWQVVSLTGNTEGPRFGSVPSNKGTTSGRSGGRVSSSGDAPAGIEGRVWNASGEWKVYGGSLGHTSTSLPNSGSKEHLTERWRFGSGEWIVYGGSLSHKSSLDAGTTLPSKENGESSSINGKLATSPPETGSFGRRGSGERIVYGGSLGRKGSWAGSDSSLSAESKEYLPIAMNLARSPPGAGRLGSGEWKLYGWRPGCMTSDSEDSAAMQLATSPPGTPGAGRFGSGGSGEWRAYGGSTGRVSRAGSADRASISRSQTISPPSSYTSSRRRLSSAGSVVRRSSSVGSASGRFTSTGSGEWKPVYSSASGCKSSVGSAGWGRGGRTTNRPRALSPAGGISVSGNSSGWLSTSKAAGSGNKLSSSPRSGRTNSTGGRVISSSDRPVRSTGSRAGSSKKRISVCKMAALSMSAAGRERSQERQRRAQRAQQHQAAASSPLVQRWLTTGVGVTSSDPEGIDDITHHTCLSSYLGDVIL